VDFSAKGDDDSAVQGAELLRIMATPVRISILRSVAREKLCVGDIAARMGIGVVSASHYMRDFHRHGVVSEEKIGANVFYSLSSSAISQLLSAVCDETI